MGPRLQAAPPPAAPGPRRCLWPGWEPLAGVGHVLEFQGPGCCAAPTGAPCPPLRAPPRLRAPLPAAPGFLGRPHRSLSSVVTLLCAWPHRAPPWHWGLHCPHETTESYNPVSAEARSLLCRQRCWTLAGPRRAWPLRPLPLQPGSAGVLRTGRACSPCPCWPAGSPGKLGRARGPESCAGADRTVEACVSGVTVLRGRTLTSGT